MKYKVSVQFPLIVYKGYTPPYVCPKCGSLISPTTKKCSKCGYVVK